MFQDGRQWQQVDCIFCPWLVGRQRQRLVSRSEGRSSQTGQKSLSVVSLYSRVLRHASVQWTLL